MSRSVPIFQRVRPNSHKLTCASRIKIVGRKPVEAMMTQQAGADKSSDAGAQPTMTGPPPLFIPSEPAGTLDTAGTQCSALVQPVVLAGVG